MNAVQTNVFIIYSDTRTHFIVMEPENVCRWFWAVSNRAGKIDCAPFVYVHIRSSDNVSCRNYHTKRGGEEVGEGVRAAAKGMNESIYWHRHWEWSEKVLICSRTQIPNTICMPKPCSGHFLLTHNFQIDKVALHGLSRNLFGRRRRTSIVEQLRYKLAHLCVPSIWLIIIITGNSILHHHHDQSCSRNKQSHPVDKVWNWNAYLTFIFSCISLLHPFDLQNPVLRLFVVSRLESLVGRVSVGTHSKNVNITMSDPGHLCMKMNKYGFFIIIRFIKGAATGWRELNQEVDSLFLVTHFSIMFVISYNYFTLLIK